MSRTIWYIVPSLRRGGAHPLIDLANGMSDRGYDIKIWTFLEDLSLSVNLRDNVEVESLGFTGKHQLWKLSRFFREFKNARPDLIHTFYFYDSMFARVVKLLSEDVLVICGVVSVKDTQRPLRRVVENELINVPDHYVSNSKAGKEHMINRGACAENIHVIYNGRDQSKFVNPPDSDYLYDEFDIDSDGYIVGNVSRLIPTKGHKDLISAVPAIQSEGFDVSLLFVGDGPARNEIESFASSIGVAEDVTITGMREDVPALLDVMDAFVFPSHEEGLPGAIIEAMHAGLPIVSTTVGGIPELIDDGKNGLLISPESPEEIESAVLSLLKQPDLGTRLGDQARKKASRKFSIEERLAEYERFYGQILCEEQGER